MPNANGPKRVAHIEDLSDAALQCHAWGHSHWDPVMLPDRQFKDGTINGRVECRCDCGTVRPENVNMMGVTWGRQYIYKDGYPFTASKAEFRAEWLRRESVRLEKRKAARVARAANRRKQPAE